MVRACLARTLGQIQVVRKSPLRRKGSILVERHFRLPVNTNQAVRGVGVGVIWDGIPFGTPVIPAKAGIQSVDRAFPKVCRVDSRFRGND
jgi:hypothetical protein